MISSAQPTPSPTTTTINTNTNYADGMSPKPSLSIKNLGVRRLLPLEELKLSAGDKVVVVIPMDKDDESDKLKLIRAKIKDRMKTRTYSRIIAWFRIHWITWYCKR